MLIFSLLYSADGLPDIELRHEWLRYEEMGFTEVVETDYLKRLTDIYYRQVFRVPVLDLDSLGLIDGGDVVGTVRDRLEMVHRDVEGQIVFKSHAWRRLFRIRGPLIRDLMREFFSTVHYRETYIGLDTDDTLVFRLGGEPR